MNVVDTSVVTKWFVRENHSDEAFALKKQEKEFIAPDYLKIEFYSNLSKRVRAGHISYEEAIEFQEKLNRISLWFERYANLQELAFEFSTTYPLTYYDSIFVALAYQRRATLYTFDLKMKRSVENTELEELVVVPGF